VDFGQPLHNAALRHKIDRPKVLKLVLGQYAAQERSPPINKDMYHDYPESYDWYAHIGFGTPLHLVAADGDLASVKLLIETGADPGIKDSKGRTALERAEIWEHSEVGDYAEVVQFLRLLETTILFCGL
jgi:hypothetical protein